MTVPHWFLLHFLLRFRLLWLSLPRSSSIRNSVKKPSQSSFATTRPTTTARQLFFKQPNPTRQQSPTQKKQKCYLWFHPINRIFLIVFSYNSLAAVGVIFASWHRIFCCIFFTPTLSCLFGPVRRVKLEKRPEIDKIINWSPEKLKVKVLHT